MRTSLVVMCGTVALGAAVLAQDAPRRQRLVADPTEFSGPPKKPPVVSAAKRAFFESRAWKNFGSKDPKALASAVHDITSFIQQDPNDSDFYLIRAIVSCQTGGDRTAMLNDITTSIKLWKPGGIYKAPRDHYTLKAKVEFD